MSKSVDFMDFGRCRIILPWLDWEYSIHTDESQIIRQGRAMHYPFEFQINKETQTARFSSTSDLPYYDTSLSCCDCYDFQERNLPCKHIYRLAVELGFIEIFKRPSFNKSIVDEIKSSCDVDNHPEQLKRQKSGMSKKCDPVELNRLDGTGIFSGSGKKPYETTTDSCTCRDFFVRRLPCKHIYRLRHELSK